MVQAFWQETLIAESDDTVIVDGNHYFPPDALVAARVRPADTKSVCPWKGTASYYDVVVGDAVNAGAAWFYPDPKPEAAQIKGRVAFWKGVTVR